jgi:hypothetical protein
LPFVTAWIGLLLGVVAAVVLGLLWQRGQGLRRGSGERIRPAEVALPGDAYGRRGTLLLFTSPQDVQRERARAVLAHAAAERPGVAVAEVDLGARGDLAGRYAVTLTPTVFVLDGDGRLRARLKGLPTSASLTEALARTAPPT